jgi:hypothetical protein
VFASRWAQATSFIPSVFDRICRYSEIRTIQVNHLLNIWLSGSEKDSGAVRKELEQQIDSYAAGQLEHAAGAVSSIWETSNKEGPVPVPPSDETEHVQPYLSFFAPKPTALETTPVLIKSIKEGYLFDRKYWARRSQEGGVEPIYFCDAVIRAELSCLDSSESLHSGGC